MSSSQLKAELEELYTFPSNSQCFDCDNKPAHWASINNGIYLCLDCSGEHRGFGVSCSYIKSVTLDQWTPTQVAFMRVGGNDRLKTFLLSHDMPDYLDKKTIYCSKLMSYYRRMLKAEANGEMFCEPMPKQENYWDESSRDEIDNNTKYTNNLFSNRNFNSNKNNDSNYSSSYPKSEIVISEDQYERARNYAETASRYTNTVPSEPKFAKVDPKYKNDSRFASIGSEPVDSNQGYFSGYGSYLGSVGSFLGGVWNVGTGVASAVKDKMAEYDVGNKLLYVGGAAVSALAYTGGKILEKGSEVIHSETAANLAEKAGDGLSYIKSKIVGGGSSSSSYKYGSKGNYSSTSSDDYYDRY